MRNLYGTRSIVPNNYSFTFDKIYYEEVPTTQNDGILIGRSVLYHPDKTVYLKTADGYKQIAKLDNTERLIRNEGMVLLPEHNVSSINYLSGDCATYNGDGLYILNYEELKTKTENGGYSQVSDSSVYDANIIYFTKKENETEYIKTICSNNYKTIGKDSIYCNYFGTADDKKYAYPLYALEDNSFQNISQNNLFYKNKGVEDCGFIPDLTGETFIYLQEYKLMIESDSGTYYLTNSQADKHKVLDNNIYYSYEKQENVYKKVTDLVVEKDYYINSNSFSLISSAPEGTEIKTKYEQYIYYLYQTTNNGDTGIQGYFIYPTEDKNWGKEQDFPYFLINNTKSYTDYRKKGILYFLSKEDENNLDSWPSIRGIPKEDYLKNSVFLLEQRSNKIIEEDEIAPQEAAITTYDDQSKLPNNVPNLYCYTIDNTEDNKIKIKEKVLISNTAENWHLAKATENKRMGVPNKLNVEMYQILTDITMCTNTDGKIIKGKLDKDTDRNNLYHNNKTFIRKGKRVYKYNEDGQGAIDEDTSQVFYKYDPADRHGLIEVPKNSNLSDTSIYVIDKDSSSWGEWEDITEQYTGYIGDLDPYTLGKRYDGINGNEIIEYEKAKLPYNKYTQYYDENGNPQIIATQADFDNSCTDGVSSIYYVKVNANRGNLNNSNTLVEATNTLDEIIGSKTRLDGTQVNQIAQGSLSKALEKDERPYSIPEDDIMDTLVHHDADIGSIESLSNKDNTYNLTFTKDNTIDANVSSSNNYAVSVRSLTDSTIKTDNMIGYIGRLKQTEGAQVNNNSHETKSITGTGSNGDSRPYNIPEENIIDTLVHHDADIGAIEDLSNNGENANTYNLTFTTETDKSKDINSFNNNTVNVRSLTDAIEKEDNMIGYIKRLGIGSTVNGNGHSKGITGTGNTKEDTEGNTVSDARPYNIPETTVIDTLVHHDADIGSIEVLKAGVKGENNNTNNLNFTIAEDPIEEEVFKQVNDIQSIKDALIILDNLIGARRRLDAEKLQTDDNTLINKLDEITDNRPVAIPEENVIDAIIHHDADIGSIEELSGTNNTYNLTFTTQKEKPINIDSSNNSVVNVRSLTDAIEKEDNMIGYIERLGIGSTVDEKGHEKKGITGTGGNGDSRPYNIPETNIIDTLVHHDADIGAIELLNGANIKFTKTTKTKGQEKSHHEIHSLTDAITILDKIIGNYDNIENSDKSNLENYHADLVTAINALDNILGKFKLTENLNASDAKTFIEAIQKLDTVLGKFNIEGTKNLKNITTFISAIQKLDTLLGTINAETIGSESVSKQIQSINSSISKINAALEEYQITDLMSYIKNLAENVDVLDVTIHNIMNEQSLMEWGTF